MAQRALSDLDAEFAAFLKKTMEDRGWSYTRFEQETGVPRSMLHFLVNGDRGASLHTVNKICARLDVNLTEIFPYYAVHSKPRSARLKKAR